MWKQQGEIQGLAHGTKLLNGSLLCARVSNLHKKTLLKAGDAQVLLRLGLTEAGIDKPIRKMVRRFAAAASDKTFVINGIHYVE